MHSKLNYFAKELFFEWSSKFLTIHMTIMAWIIFKIAKYFYYGSEHAGKIWSANRITSYQVLSHVWEKEIINLVLVLPLAVLLDILLKRWFPQNVSFSKKKANPGPN